MEEGDKSCLFSGSMAFLFSPWLSVNCFIHLTSFPIPCQRACLLGGLLLQLQLFHLCLLVKQRNLLPGLLYSFTAHLLLKNFLSQLLLVEAEEVVASLEVLLLVLLSQVHNLLPNLVVFFLCHCYFLYYLVALTLSLRKVIDPLRVLLFELLQVLLCDVQSVLNLLFLLVPHFCELLWAKFLGSLLLLDCLQGLLNWILFLHQLGLVDSIIVYFLIFLLQLLLYFLEALVLQSHVIFKLLLDIVESSLEFFLLLDGSVLVGASPVSEIFFSF